MPSGGRSPETSDAIHALIVEDDILVAAFLAGALLDRGIAADRAVMEDCSDYLLRRRYDVAVVGVDRKSASVASAIRLLQQRGIAIVLFTVLDDPHKLAAAFPHLAICLYDARYSDSIAVQVADAAAALTQPVSDGPARARSSRTRRDWPRR